MRTKLTHPMHRTLLAALLLTPSLPALAQPLSDEAVLQLLQRVNDLEQEIRSLRGENEQLQNKLQNLQQKQESSLQQVDEKLDKLQTADKTETTNKPAPEKQVGNDIPPGISWSDTNKPDAPNKDTAEKPDKSDTSGFYSYGTGKSDDKNLGIIRTANASDLEKKKEDEKSSAGDTTKAEDKSSTGDNKLPEREERAVYDQAFETLLKDPRKAVDEFRAFLKDYPQSPLAPDAQYWIGEGLYADKDYSAASEAFLTLLKEHKNSNKAADAALKLGYCFYEMKEWEKARKTLQDVITFFPDNADTKRLAQERLDKMQKEGH